MAPHGVKTFGEICVICVICGSFLNIGALCVIGGPVVFVDVSGGPGQDR